MPLGPPEVAETRLPDYPKGGPRSAVSMPLGPPEVAETRLWLPFPKRFLQSLNALRATRGR